MNANDGQRGDLTDLQRRGISSASDMFERFIEQIEEMQTPHPRVDRAIAAFDTASSNNGPVSAPQARAAIARAIDLYADLFQRTFDLYADLLENGLRSGDGTASNGSGSPVTLTGTPGEAVGASVWIHNSKPAPVTGITLRMTTLTAHDGGEIEADLGTFAPGALDVPAAASGSSRLALTIPSAAAPSIYHGHILATGLPGASLPVRLVVQW